MELKTNALLHSPSLLLLLFSPFSYALPELYTYKDTTSWSMSTICFGDENPVEQLFLDISVQQILKRDGLSPVDPWDTLYVDAIHDGRYGDAIWARYHLFGDVNNDGTILETNLTVLETINEDAVGYKRGYPDEYAKAVSFYGENMSNADGHVDVLEIIFRVDGEDVGVYVAETESD